MARLMFRRDGKMFPGIVDQLYTTVELLATEQRIIQHAVAGIDTGRWVVPHRLVETRWRRQHHLTDGQREIRRLYTSEGADEGEKRKTRRRSSRSGTY